MRSWIVTVIVSGLGVVFWALLAVVVLLSSHERASYFGFVVAAAGTLLTVALVVWLRGLAAQRLGQTRTSVLVVSSWAATALLFVPAIAVFSSVQPLPHALVCLARTYRTQPAGVRGSLIGQTSDRVYLGVPARHQIVVVPMARVAALTFGSKNAVVGATCG